MSRTTTTTYQRAAKPHCCDWCGEQIEPGLLYARWRWFSYTDAITVRVHLECDLAAAKGDWDAEFDGQWQRGGLLDRWDVASYDSAVKIHELRTGGEE